MRKLAFHILVWWEIKVAGTIRSQRINISWLLTYNHLLVYNRVCYVICGVHNLKFRELGNLKFQELGNLETWELGNLKFRELGNFGTWGRGNSLWCPGFCSSTR